MSKAVEQAKIGGDETARQQPHLRPVEKRVVTVAVAGNPNAGKSTLINAIAGSRLHVGNWPGVTVEKKEAQFEFEGRTIRLVDLPGTYSLSPYTQEEIIARDYLIHEKPDLVINVVDATNLERNLYLTMQLLELGLPVVMALNIFDEAEAKGYKIDVKGIEKMLGKTFGHYKPWVVVRSRTQMRTIVEKAPKGFGKDPDTYLYDVMFLKEPLTACTAVKKMPTHEEVDDVFTGRGVVYFSRVKSMATRSKLNRVASLPIYKSMTIRNWNTTARLLRLMDEA